MVAKICTLRSNGIDQLFFPKFVGHFPLLWLGLGLFGGVKKQLHLLNCDPCDCCANAIEQMVVEQVSVRPFGMAMAEYHLF